MGEEGGTRQGGGEQRNMGEEKKGGLAARMVVPATPAMASAMGLEVSREMGISQRRTGERRLCQRGFRWVTGHSQARVHFQGAINDLAQSGHHGCPRWAEGNNHPQDSSQRSVQRKPTHTKCHGPLAPYPTPPPTPPPPSPTCPAGTWTEASSLLYTSGCRRVCLGWAAPAGCSVTAVARCTARRQRGRGAGGRRRSGYQHCCHRHRHWHAAG